MTDPSVVVVTGAAGFLGSALTVDLSRDHAVTAIDRRAPGQALRDAAPQAVWHQVDICDKAAVENVLQGAKQRHGRIDFVLHFAAFYHFDTDWRPEYQRTNIDGTSIVQQAAAQQAARRLIFASSMVAMLPPPPGERLNEQSPTADYIPYGKSKSIGEQLVRDGTNRLPATVLRIAGVFSDWCELPPLDSLIRLWAGSSPLSRIVAGRGETGIPYIFRDDLVRLVRCCLAHESEMTSDEVFLASQHGAVSHNELFRLVRQARRHAAPGKPLFLPRAVAVVGVRARRALGLVTRRPPYERPWMLQFIDRPWTADTTLTRNKLRWDCLEENRLCNRLPTMVQRFLRQRREWERRSRARAENRYEYGA